MTVAVLRLAVLLAVQAVDERRKDVGLRPIGCRPAVGFVTTAVALLATEAARDRLPVDRLLLRRERALVPARRGAAAVPVARRVARVGEVAVLLVARRRGARQAERARDAERRNQEAEVRQRVVSMTSVYAAISSSVLASDVYLLETEKHFLLGNFPQ